MVKVRLQGERCSKRERGGGGGGGSAVSVNEMHGCGSVRMADL